MFSFETIKGAMEINRIKYTAMENNVTTFNAKYVRYCIKLNTKKCHAFLQV